MITNPELIRTVTIGMKPMRIVVNQDIPKSALTTMLKNDPEKRDTKHAEDRILVPSRFAALVDEFGNVLNTVTPRTYNLIKNKEVIAALDLVTDDAGYEIKAMESRYYKGRSLWRFTEPEPFYVPGDNSPHFVMLDVWHDSRGTGGLSTRGGIYRQWCTNGCTTTIFATERKSTTHREQVNLMEFFQETVETLAKNSATIKQIHQNAGEMEFDLQTDNAVRQVMVEAYRSLAPRYRPRLSETIRRYAASRGRTGDASDRDSVGPTVHALLQSVSDLVTHGMQDGVRRHEWGHQTSEALIEAITA